jgi:ATP-independent RNA helicase DbpA
LFSATYPDDILSLSSRFQNAPQQISVESHHNDPQIDQHFFICQKNARLDGLVTLLNSYRPSAAVVFCNTKQLTREVCGHLEQNGISARAIHGDLEQRDRDQVLIQFRQRSCSVLVATDVAARGLDIDQLPAVVNFELPRNAEVYVHRIGRTGRAGRGGLALTLFGDSERYKLDAIGQYLGRELEFEAIETLDACGKTMPPPAFITLRIAGGRKDKIRPGDILGALTGDAGIDGKAVGKIDVMDYAAYVAIDEAVAGQALGRLINGKIKGRKFKVRRV